MSSRSTTTKEQSKPKEGSASPLERLSQDMACIYLEDNDFELLERDWKSQSGTADIIAMEDDILVFIEVKTRSQSYAGLPEYAVTAERRSRYEEIAIDYLTKNKRPSGRVRFDVIAVKMTGEQQCMLRHHRDAFGVVEEPGRKQPAAAKEAAAKEKKPAQRSKKSAARER